MELRRVVMLLGGVVAALAAGLVLNLAADAPEVATDRGDHARSEGRAHPDRGPQSSSDRPGGRAGVDEGDLPAEARDTLALIDAGGPFPYPQDDQTFFNREGLLPEAPEGYYREYTVPTPGEDDRGARRIVTGREGEYYWTSDHYASFERIVR